MKKISIISAMLVFFYLIQSSITVAAEVTPIYINNAQEEFIVAPYTVNGSIFVPVRLIAEAFNVSVDWNDKTQQATIVRGDDKLVLQLGLDIAWYNDVEVPLPIAPQIKDNTIFLPLRYVAEWLQLQVDYKNGAVYLQTVANDHAIDTLDLPKGNTNANLATGGDMLFWQNKIYFRHRMYIEGLACTANIVQWTPETNEFNPERPEPEYETILPGDNYSHFNIWQGEVYAVCNNDFVKLGVDFKPIQTLAQAVSYAQIQDGWLYYITKAEEPENEKLYRQKITGEDRQDLELKNIQYPNDWLQRPLLITDSHIYAYVQNSDGDKVLFSMALDGSNRREVIALDNVGALDYADGYLYFNLGYDYGNSNDKANIVRSSLHRIKTDGTGLEKISQEGASDINIVGDWLYFSKIDPIYTSDDGDMAFSGWRLCRIRKNGNDFQILTDGQQNNSQTYAIPMFYNGRLFFTEIYAGNGQQWWEL